MFRTAEIGRKISKDDFREIQPALRIELVEIQQAIRKAQRFPVIIVFAGVDGAGKSETINLFNEWMDPRWIDTRAYGPRSDEERERPRFWRYWRDLPATGRIGLFLTSWYSRPILDQVHGVTDEPTFMARLERITRFEKALADDGALILKFWMHLSRDAQKKRLKALESDPNERWRATKKDWDNWKLYDRFIAAAEDTISRTSTATAPWLIVEGADHRYRSVTACTTFRDAAKRHLAESEAAAAVTSIQPAEAPSDVAAVGAAVAPGAAVTKEGVQPPPQPSILDALDMSQSLSKATYEERLAKAMARLNSLYRRAKEKGVSTALVFEGWDAAGKGGTIRRLVQAMDARDYAVIPVAAPTDEERQHHYLWRFWRQMSRAGRVTVWDRSWYGRVLVERVEGFATVDEWRRAYAEITDFESDLIDHGMVVCKFWIHITPEEQLARFENRRDTPYKRWKLTDEDWRNREKWGAYAEAVAEMIERTSTHHAPWVLVEANDKRFARIKVFESVIGRLAAALD